jgi:hypothetical protein
MGSIPDPDREDAVSASVVESQRVVRAYRQTIDARPDVVFRLLCPVREVEWLDGFAFTMIYSASGLVEEGAVFSTANPGEEDTVWIVTRHDRAARLVEFARFTPASRTCILRIAVEPCGEAHSHVDVSYEFTSIAHPGNEFLKEWTEEAFLSAVVFWEQSMNHFLKTGVRLSRSATD